MTNHFQLEKFHINVKDAVTSEGGLTIVPLDISQKKEWPNIFNKTEKNLGKKKLGSSPTTGIIFASRRADRRPNSLRTCRHYHLTRDFPNQVPGHGQFDCDLDLVWRRRVGILRYHRRVDS